VDSSATAFFFAGLSAGLAAAVAVWFAAHASAAREAATLRGDLGAALATAQAKAEEESRRSTELQERMAARETALLDTHKELAEAQQHRARLTAELEGERKLAGEKLALLHDAETKLRDAFSALSADALRTNNDTFLQLASGTLERAREAAATDLASRQKEIAGLVEPLRESLGKMNEHIQQVDRDRATSAQALTTQLQAVGETQERLRRETEGLVRALKSPNQRGRWGEVQLRNVIERAGMAAYCGDFQEKDVVADEDGRRAIPDMTVRLPNGSCVVIDSKVPIDAYLRAVDTTDDAHREELFRTHARQVREHIRGLAAKTYWAKFTPTPELVVMFVPGEPLFSIALQADPTLFDYAADQRVIPASPLTLLALLRTVASAWQQQRMAENAEQVRALGTELYERLALMAEYVQDVGTNLKQAGAAYDRFIGSLESRVLVTARRFRDLGVSATKEIHDPALPLDLELREPRSPEFRLPIQESLIDAEIVMPDVKLPTG
jgi:DNA recombination protein RmuC